MEIHHYSFATGAIFQMEEGTSSIHSLAILTLLRPLLQAITAKNPNIEQCKMGLKYF